MTRSRMAGVPLALSIGAMLVFNSSAAAQPARAVPETLVVGCKWSDSVVFYDGATGREQTTVPIGRRPHEMAMSADGKLAFVSLYGPP